MAVTASGFATLNYITYNSVAQTPALGGSLLLDTHKMTLWVNTITPNFDDTLANNRYGTSVWTAGANEASGTNWAAGGKALSTLAAGGTSISPTLTASAGTVRWGATDVSVASTTIATAFGTAMIYADGITAPNADPVIVVVYFGGSTYTTAAGTLGITWSGGFIATFDITP